MVHISNVPPHFPHPKPQVSSAKLCLPNKGSLAEAKQACNPKHQMASRSLEGL